MEWVRWDNLVLSSSANETTRELYAFRNHNSPYEDSGDELITHHDDTPDHMGGTGIPILEWEKRKLPGMGGMSAWFARLSPTGMEQLSKKGKNHLTTTGEQHERDK